MGFWSSLLKAGGKAAGATGKAVGGAVLHPSQTLRGAGSALKTATVGAAAGYVGWEKLTTDKSGVSNGNAGNMLGNFFSNLAHGKVSGLSIVGLIAGAFLVFGRTGWLGKIAGIFLTMMMIGNNTQRLQEASVTDNQRQARPQQEQEEQTHSGGMRR